MLNFREIEHGISRYEQKADKLDQGATLPPVHPIRDRLKEGRAKESEARPSCVFT